MKDFAHNLLKAKAYQDLAEPVILTSGELGIYYINTEKLVGDDNGWTKFAEDSVGMINHCWQFYQNNLNYREIIDELARRVKQFAQVDLISGGQRRDWIFSGPVARVLNLPHLSLFKDRRAQIIHHDQVQALAPDAKPLTGKKVVHIVDLLTKGSSAFNPVDQSGWIPEIRKFGGEIQQLLTVTDRDQGADEILSQVGVKTQYLVRINSEFLRQHSSHPERALAFIANPRQWAEQYLSSAKLSQFLPNFNPNSGKQDRAKKFLEQYRANLLAHPEGLEFLNEIKNQFGINLNKLQ